jgi:hypothetical protein
MNQVHKESLDKVENALPNRNGLDIEIFGMEGIPEDVIGQHTQRIIQSYYQEQAERFAATGNPPPGQAGNGQPAKKRFKVETPEEVKARFTEWVKAKKEGREQAQQAQATQNVVGGGDRMVLDGPTEQSVSNSTQIGLLGY